MMARITEYLFRVHPAVEGRELRLRSRFLAMLTLFIPLSIVLAIGLLALDRPRIVDDPDVISVYLFGAAAIISFALNRRGHFHTAARLSVFAILIIAVVAPFLPGSADQFVTILVLPVLLAGILNSPRLAALVAGLTIALAWPMLLSSPFLTSPARQGYIDNLVFVMFIDVAFIIFMLHLHAIERLRRAELSQANHELRRLQAELQRHNEHLEEMVDERTAQLRQANAQTDLILRHTSEAIALIHLDGAVVRVNRAFSELFGSRPNQTIVHILGKLSGDDTQFNSMTQAVQQALAQSAEQRITVQMRSRDGRARDFDLALTPVNPPGDAAQAGLLLSARDITHLKEIERFKARFVADALHDLATPITALNTRLYLLNQQPGQLGSHFKALENQVRHLRNLLDDLRTIARLDRNEMELVLELASLNEIVERVYDTYEPVALDNQQTLHLLTDPALPPLRLDRKRMERVIVNLVANAIAYTPAGKSIHIWTAREADACVVGVRDEGMGISAEDLPHVFQRFYRAAEARRLVAGGTGLGLAIVKHVTEAHHGAVAAESQPGEGSTFTVRLPLPA